MLQLVSYIFLGASASTSKLQLRSFRLETQGTRHIPLVIYVGGELGESGKHDSNVLVGTEDRGV